MLSIIMIFTYVIDVAFNGVLYWDSDMAFMQGQLQKLGSTTSQSSIAMPESTANRKQEELPGAISGTQLERKQYMSNMALPCNISMHAQGNVPSRFQCDIIQSLCS